MGTPKQHFLALGRGRFFSLPRHDPPLFGRFAKKFRVRRAEISARDEIGVNPGDRGLPRGIFVDVAHSRPPQILLPGAPPRFPDPSRSDARGLVAAGGELSPDWLLSAYERGIFPWYDEGLPILWWSPDPRTLLDASSLHVSRSMRRFIRSTALSLTHNRAFTRVMLESAREREGGTWILPEMVEAYTRLFELGHAHSIEVWQDSELVGGLYGVQRGALFAAESMFHRVANASKLALIASVQTLFDAGIRLFDVQFTTPHLSSLGAYEVSRREYLARVSEAVGKPVNLAALEVRAQSHSD